MTVAPSKNPIFPLSSIKIYVCGVVPRSVLANKTPAIKLFGHVNIFKAFFNATLLDKALSGIVDNLVFIHDVVGTVVSLDELDGVTTVIIPLQFIFPDTSNA